VNTYGYSEENPIQFIDEMGLNPGAAAGGALVLICARNPRLCGATLICIKNPESCTRTMCDGVCKGYQTVCKSEFSSSGGPGGCKGDEGCYLSALKCTHWGACCLMRSACNICRFGGLGHRDRSGNRTQEDDRTAGDCKQASKCCAQAKEKCWDCGDWW